MVVGKMERRCVLRFAKEKIGIKSSFLLETASVQYRPKVYFTPRIAFKDHTYKFSEVNYNQKSPKYWAFIGKGEPSLGIQLSQVT